MHSIYLPDGRHSEHRFPPPLSPARRPLEDAAALERSPLRALARSRWRGRTAASARPRGRHLRRPCLGRGRAVLYGSGADSSHWRTLHHRPQHRRVLRTQSADLRALEGHGSRRSLFLLARCRECAGRHRREDALSPALLLRQHASAESNRTEPSTTPAAASSPAAAFASRHAIAVWEKLPPQAKPGLWNTFSPSVIASSLIEQADSSWATSIIFRGRSKLQKPRSASTNYLPRTASSCPTSRPSCTSRANCTSTSGQPAKTDKRIDKKTNKKAHESSPPRFV